MRLVKIIKEIIKKFGAFTRCLAWQNEEKSEDKDFFYRFCDYVTRQ